MFHLNHVQLFVHFLRFLCLCTGIHERIISTVHSLPVDCFYFASVPYLEWYHSWVDLVLKLPCIRHFYSVQSSLQLVIKTACSNAWKKAQRRVTVCHVNKMLVYLLIFLFDGHWYASGGSYIWIGRYRESRILFLCFIQPPPHTPEMRFKSNTNCRNIFLIDHFI